MGESEREKQGEDLYDKRWQKKKKEIIYFSTDVSFFIIHHLAFLIYLLIVLLNDTISYLRSVLFFLKQGEWPHGLSSSFFLGLVQKNLFVYFTYTNQITIYTHIYAH